MTDAVTDRLHRAARVYGDAKVAIDDYEGPRHGQGFETLLRALRTATVEFTSAGRAYAAQDRAREKADAERATAEG